MSSSSTTSARQRYIAKPYGKSWRVYDREIGSYPVQRAEFDSVLPSFRDEADCAALAEELDRRERQGSK